MSSLTIIGSSDAFNGAGRHHSCYLIESDEGAKVMVDFGPTALRALHATGRSAREVDVLAITHLHGDHVGGWPFLMIDGLFNDVRLRPLTVVGPLGTRERLRQGMEVGYGDLSHHKRQYDLSIVEVAPGSSWAANVAGGEKLTIRGFAADHMDEPESPLCLRIEVAGAALAFSGDTAFCEGLFEAGRDADIFVAECSALAPPCGRHCHVAGWKDQLHQVTAKKLLLTHLSDSVRRDVDRLQAMLQEAAPTSVQLSFADDGQIHEF